MNFGNFRAMANSSKVPFPEKLYCDSSSGDLIGSYLLVDSRSRDFSKLLVSHEAVSPYVYLNANRTHSNLLVYCEGTPDLIPADMWRAVITEALSRQPDASRVLSIRGKEVEAAAVQICAEIKNAAMSACRDLVGWIIFTERNGVWGITARCVRSLDPDTPTTIPSSPLGSTGRFSKLVADYSNVWEVRGRDSTSSVLPWLKYGGLDTRWINLLSQVGCFDTNETKPVSVMLRPITTPTKEILPTVDESTISAGSMSTMITPPGSPQDSGGKCYGTLTQIVAEKKFRWDVCEKIYQMADDISSPMFRYKDVEYFVNVSGLYESRSSSSPYLKVSLKRTSNTCENVKFAVTVQAGGCIPPLSSGWKWLGPEGVFEVLFDRNRVVSTEAGHPVTDLQITLEFDNPEYSF